MRNGPSPGHEAMKVESIPGFLSVEDPTQGCVKCLVRCEAGCVRKREQTFSISRGLAVFARFASADVDALAVVHFDLDRLVATVAADIEAHIVSAVA